MKYIVYNDHGPLMLGHYNDTPRGGVLLSGYFTQSMTRKQADRAIARTTAYAAKHNLRWDCHRLRIVRLKVTP